MSLSKRIGLIISVAVVSVTLIAITVTYTLSKENRQESLKVEMSTILDQSLKVLKQTEALHQEGAINLKKLADEAKSAKVNTIEELRKLPVYKAIPVVMAWTSATDAAHK
ncbi:hypothetical protein EP331_11510 [bacterium]|nr:MAG: hypothetical protein EP331_11510 [bacterium]